MSGIKNIKPGLRVLFAVAALVAAVVIPAQAAVAGTGCSKTQTDPTQAQYCSVAGEKTSHNGNHGTGPENSSGGGPNNGSGPTSADGSPAATTAVESSSTGSLPFTGLDVGILAIVAVALTGTGLLLRRFTASGVARS